MAISLGTFTFSAGRSPSDGAIETIQPQRWSRFEVIGAANPGSILTYLGSSSRTHRLVAWVTEGDKNSLKAIYDARGTVSFAHDWGTATVQMTQFSAVKTRATRGTNRFIAQMELVER